MSDGSWWTNWGQSATAVGGFVMGGISLWVTLKNARMAREKHAWEKGDRAREEARERWCREKVEALRGLPREGNRIVEVENDHVDWAQRAHAEGRLKALKRGDGKWFVMLP